MLFRAYSNPMDLISRYINQRRFGEFVQGFIQAEIDRKNAEIERENERLLWTAWVHSYSEKTFEEWKAEALKDGQQKQNKDNNLTDDGVKNIIGRLFPSQTNPGK